MSNRIIIVGAGGHAKVCIDVLRAAGESIAYCISNSNYCESLMGIPVLSGDENLRKLRKVGYFKAFVAIGSNEVRIALALKCIAEGYTLINSISNHAYIAKSALIGKGVAIMPGAIINADTIIRDFSIVNTGATIDHDCQIGEAVHVGPQCALAGNVIVESGATLGIGCKVIPGIRIEQKAIVAAGAVVIDNVVKKTTVAGVPAKTIKLEM